MIPVSDVPQQVCQYLRWLICITIFNSTSQCWSFSSCKYRKVVSAGVARKVVSSNRYPDISGSHVTGELDCACCSQQQRTLHAAQKTVEASERMAPEQVLSTEQVMARCCRQAVPMPSGLFSASSADEYTKQLAYQVAASSQSGLSWLLHGVAAGCSLYS